MSQKNNTFECAICCDEYKVADAITCTACGYQSCTTCTRQYLCNERSAQCMNTSCRALWTELFIRKSFPKSWIDKQYIPHVKAIIMDQERSWLPDAMAIAPYCKEIGKANKELKEFDTRYAHLLAAKASCKDAIEKHKKAYEQESKRDEKEKARKRIKRAKSELQQAQDLIDYRKTDITRRIRHAENNIENYRQQHNQIVTRGKDEYISDYVIRIQRARAARLREDNTLVDSETQALNKQNSELASSVYIMRCPKSGCNAFISKTNMKCGLCETKVCVSCRQIEAGEHKCNKDDVASVKAISADKDVKPCPKCCELIYRPYGCNHMWCTVCKTSFDWATGKLIKDSANTNPYYHQWRMSQSGAGSSRGGFADRLCSEDVFDIVSDEVRVFTEDMQTAVATKFGVGLHNALTRVQDSLSHLTWFIASLRTLRDDMNQALGAFTNCAYLPEFNRVVRGKHLAGVFDEAMMTTQVFKTYKRYQYNLTLRMLCSEFVAKVSSYALETIYFLNGSKQTIMDAFFNDYLRIAEFPMYQAYAEQRLLRCEGLANHLNAGIDMVEGFNKEVEQATTLFGYTEAMRIVSTSTRYHNCRVIVHKLKEPLSHGYHNAVFCYDMNLDPMYAPISWGSKTVGATDGAKVVNFRFGSA